MSKIKTIEHFFEREEISTDGCYHIFFMHPYGPHPRSSVVEFIEHSTLITGKVFVQAGVLWESGDFRFYMESYEDALNMRLKYGADILIDKFSHGSVVNSLSNWISADLKAAWVKNIKEMKRK